MSLDDSKQEEGRKTHLINFHRQGDSWGGRDGLVNGYWNLDLIKLNVREGSFDPSKMFTKGRVI